MRTCSEFGAAVGFYASAKHVIDNLGIPRAPAGMHGHGHSSTYTRENPSLHILTARVQVEAAKIKSEAEFALEQNSNNTHSIEIPQP